jgi:hypothetical protein
LTGRFFLLAPPLPHISNLFVDVGRPVAANE